MGPKAMPIELCVTLGQRQSLRCDLPLAEAGTALAALNWALAHAPWPAAERLRLERLLRQQQLQPAVWGRQVPWEQALRDGERLCLLTPLQVDPKVARRERFARQGAKKSGLFARRRPGAAAGY